MKVLLISRCPPYPLHLGDRLIVYHLARELQKLGCTIDLLAFSDRLDDLADRHHYIGFFRHVHLIPEPSRPMQSVFARMIGLTDRFPRSAEQTWSAEMARLITRMRSENQYDLAHLFGGIQVYEYAAMLDGAPALITPYESYALYLRRAKRGLADRVRLYAARAYEQFMFTPYRSTVVVSEPDRAELLTLNPALDVRVIPNGVDLERFQPTGQARQPATLIFTGNYEYAPNVDAALTLIHEILPRVQAEIPEAVLQIVGNAPPPELQALASSSVNITGRVESLVPYLASASVYVSPLRFGAGIKNKVLEALAMGCPVIGTSLSMDGIHVIDGESALVADTPAALAAAAVRVLRDRQLGERLSVNGIRLIREQYTWEAAAAAYHALYREVCGCA